MALTSTAFMAAPGAWTSTLANKLDKIDCSQVLAAVLKGDKQLLGHIKMAGVARNIEYNWIEDDLNAAFVIASSSANNVMTVTSPSGTASLQRVLRNNAVINPAGSEVYMKVAAAVTKLTLTAAAFGSTTWASWTATKCYVVAQPYADIDSASSDISKLRTKRKNFTQVFERAVQITQSRKGMDMEAVTSELQLQIMRRTMEIKRELDMSVLRGYATATGSNVYSADTELRTMAGIIQLIRDPNLDSTSEDTTVINKSSAALSIAGLNSLCYLVWGEGGLDEMADPIFVVGAKQQRVIAGFESELRRVEQGERTTGYYRDVFLSDMGVEIPVVLDRWCPEDKVILLDRSRVALKPLAGDNWHMEKMAKTGRNETWQISGQFTIELRNSNACHGLIYNLA